MDAWNRAQGQCTKQHPPPEELHAMPVPAHFPAVPPGISMCALLADAQPPVEPGNNSEAGAGDPALAIRIEPGQAPADGRRPPAGLKTSLADRWNAAAGEALPVFLREPTIEPLVPAILDFVGIDAIEDLPPDILAASPRLARAVQALHEYTHAVQPPSRCCGGLVGGYVGATLVLSGVGVMLVERQASNTGIGLESAGGAILAYQFLRCAAYRAYSHCRPQEFAKPFARRWALIQHTRAIANLALLSALATAGSPTQDTGSGGRIGWLPEATESQMKTIKPLLRTFTLKLVEKIQSDEFGEQFFNRRRSQLGDHEKHYAYDESMSNTIRDHCVKDAATQVFEEMLQDLKSSGQPDMEAQTAALDQLNKAFLWRPYPHRSGLENFVKAVFRD